MAKIGRPATETAKIIPEQLEKLMAMGPSEQETSDFFDVKVSTLRVYIKKTYGIPFTQFREKRFVHTRISIKRAQIAKALKGDNTMLIWCGKQYCGQSEKVEEKRTETSNVDITYHSEWGSTAEPAPSKDSD